MLKTRIESASPVVAKCTLTLALDMQETVNLLIIPACDRKTKVYSDCHKVGTKSTLNVRPDNTCLYYFADFPFSYHPFLVPHTRYVSRHSQCNQWVNTHPEPTARTSATNYAQRAPRPPVSSAPPRNPARGFGFRRSM